jgi:cytochrome c553
MMFKELIVAVSLTLTVFSPFALAGPEAASSASSKHPNSPWNAAYPEKNAALTLLGDAKAGEDTYQTYCAACHLPSGAGNPDGGIPQLAGQHRTVLIKQLADIRAGVRDNPAMYPFAIELPDAQALADVATYIETLCIPRGAGQYEAPDAAEQIAYGKRLFEKECSLCHGLTGDGMAEKFYPVLAGQHYAYLLRQLADIRAGKRGNAHPTMVRLIAKYDNAQLVALSAYQASLATRPRGWVTQPRFCAPE